MTTITPVPLIDPAQTPLRVGPAPGANPVSPAQDGAASRFQGALDRAGATQSPPVDPAAGPQAPDAARARRSLDLDARAAAPDAPQGDAILNGLQRLRGAFDGGLARLDQVISAPSVDVQTLLAVQMEMVNYSLLVDTTSKLTGKSTQSFDSLMKGQ